MFNPDHFIVLIAIWGYQWISGVNGISEIVWICVQQLCIHIYQMKSTEWAAMTTGSLGLHCLSVKQAGDERGQQLIDKEVALHSIKLLGQALWELCETFSGPKE